MACYLKDPQLVSLHAGTVLLLFTGAISLLVQDKMDF